MLQYIKVQCENTIALLVSGVVNAVLACVYLFIFL